MDTEKTPTRVTARDVLQALSEVRRRGQWTLFQELESIEPDLAEFVLEEVSAIHRTLLDTGSRPKAVRRFQRQVQSLVLVTVLSLRKNLEPRSGGSVGHVPPDPLEENNP